MENVCSVFVLTKPVETPILLTDNLVYTKPVVNLNNYKAVTLIDFTQFPPDSEFTTIALKCIIKSKHFINLNLYSSKDFRNTLRYLQINYLASNIKNMELD